jgi:hypothetical protein
MTTNLFKKISWLAVLAMITVTVIVYVCPMSYGGLMKMNMGTRATVSICGANFGAGAVASPGCVNSHLSVISQILGNVPQTINALLMLVVLFTVFYFLSHKLLFNTFRHLASRFRYRHRYYQYAIKSIVDGRMLRYLNLISNYTIAL